jgi:hypothetical protein
MRRSKTKTQSVSARTANGTISIESDENLNLRLSRLLNLVCSSLHLMERSLFFFCLAKVKKQMKRFFSLLLLLGTLANARLAPTVIPHVSTIGKQLIGRSLISFTVARSVRSLSRSLARVFFIFVHCVNVTTAQYREGRAVALLVLQLDGFCGRNKAFNSFSFR